jgi:hypothetical protein
VHLFDQEKAQVQADSLNHIHQTVTSYITEVAQLTSTVWTVEPLITTVFTDVQPAQKTNSVTETVVSRMLPLCLLGILMMGRYSTSTVPLRLASRLPPLLRVPQVL